MKILITGIGGFVGRHLVAECLASGHELFGYDRVTAGPDERPVPREIGDLCDGTTVRRAVAAFRPEACVHLAGMASVPACARNPEEAFRINVEGSLQFLRAFHAENLDTRFLFVSTSHVYGRGEGCLAETSPVKPDSLYALSKWCAEQAVLMTAREFGRPALVVRPVNHIGPGQARDYVVASFAAQLAEIARGESPPVLRVGNLESKRDFLDVRDVVRAYRLLLEKGTPGEVYNLASNQPVSIRRMLDCLIALSGLSPTLETDPALYRPTDGCPDLDTSKLRKATGWKPAFSLDTTLADLFADAAKS